MDRAALCCIAAAGGVAAFGASSLSVALFGLGVPFLLAALIAACWAAGLLYALARWATLPDDKPR